MVSELADSTSTTSDPSPSLLKKNQENPVSQSLPSMDLPSLAKTLNFQLPIKLDFSNYVYWKALVLPAVRAFELEDFINGNSICPPKFIEVSSESEGLKESTLNSNYSTWRRTDQLLLCWLLSTISQEVIGQVTSCVSSFEVWKTLENLHSQMSMARVPQIKQQLQNMKKGSMNISEYFLKIKTLGDNLRSAGQVVTEYDLVLSALNGLGHDFDPVVVFISSQRKTMSMQEAEYLLMVHEQRLEQRNCVNQGEVTGAASVHFASNKNMNARGADGNNSRGRGRWYDESACQLCGKNGHVALQCYRRFDQNWHGSPQSSRSGHSW